MRRCSRCWGALLPDEDTRATKYGPEHYDDSICELLIEDTSNAPRTPAYEPPRIPAADSGQHP